MIEPCPLLDRQASVQHALLVELAADEVEAEW
jgi:hypothetical protein